MKVEATTLDADHAPELTIELYRDRNGNWFAGSNKDGLSFYTATYSTPIEALKETLVRASLPKKEKK